MKYSYITNEERKRIEALYSAGERPSDISRKTGIHLSTIYRELARGYTGELDADNRPEYSAAAAEHMLRAAFRQKGRTGKREKKAESEA
jgi:IS30 family transposase